MELLATIKESDLDLDTYYKEPEKYKLRKAARAIILDEDGRVALLNVSLKSHYKLPGGGVEEAEDLALALNRESQEEIGCSVEIISEVGKIIELRNELSLRQESFCYIARVVGEKGEPNFTAKEQSYGFKIVWVENLDEAIDKLVTSAPVTYESKFIVKRDLLFLQKAKEVL